MRPNTRLIARPAPRKNVVFLAFARPLFEVKPGAKRALTRSHKNANSNFRIATYLLANIDDLPAHLRVIGLITSGRFSVT